jgi:hypothetical protein
MSINYMQVPQFHLDGLQVSVRQNFVLKFLDEAS